MLAVFHFAPPAGRLPYPIGVQETFNIRGSGGRGLWRALLALTWLAAGQGTCNPLAELACAPSICSLAAL